MRNVDITSGAISQNRENGLRLIKHNLVTLEDIIEGIKGQSYRADQLMVVNTGFDLTFEQNQAAYTRGGNPCLVMAGLLQNKTLGLMHSAYIQSREEIFIGKIKSGIIGGSLDSYEFYKGNLPSSKLKWIPQPKPTMDFNALLIGSDLIKELTGKQSMPTLLYAYAEYNGGGGNVDYTFDKQLSY